ncbi:MAG: vitamin K epoxide reductase family protein [Candidatus Levybacteria bacterium]|nr:vitamin K epoxide reductase family protein [Candidatus Levybacteria bacterium]
MRLNSVYTYIKVLSLIGIGLAIYLLYEQFTNSPFSPCNISETINCDPIVKGELAKTFGISTPLLGLLGYVFIFIFSFLQKKKALFSVATFGFLFCLWIGYRELFEFKTICPICIACTTVITLIFILSFLIVKKTVKN